MQLVLFADPIEERVGTEGPLIYVASTVAVLLALLRNVRLPGFPILAVGAILNLVAVVANGGSMPSSAEAWLELTGSAALPVAHFSNVALIGPDTLFPFLGDIFVFPRPLPLATVFSIGDALIALGAVVFLVAAMRWPARVASGPRPSRRCLPDSAAGTALMSAEAKEASAALRRLALAVDADRGALLYLDRGDGVLELMASVCERESASSPSPPTRRPPEAAAGCGGS